MANTKVLNTRISLKYDTLANWELNNPVLNAGEVAVVTVAATPTQTVNSVAAPQILFKVGDGRTNFKALAWASGLAADVYSWAKAENKPSYAASEINGLQKFVEDHDTNTTYQVISGSKTGMYQLQKKEKGSTTWSNVGAEFGIDASKIPTSFDITANATDDDVIILTGQGGKNSVSYDAKHAEKGPSAGYISANTTVSIGAGESKTIKVPQIQVDKYGHTIKAADEDITITIPKMPTIPSGTGEVNPADNVTVVDSVKLSGHTLSGSTKKFVGARGIDITGTTDQITVTGPDLSTYATKTDVESAVAGAVQYYGVVNSETDLGKDMTASGSPKPAAIIDKGDFYRVGTAFGSLKVGDLLIAKAGQESYTSVSNYDRVIQEDYKGTVTSVTVTGNDGLTGTDTVTSSGTITLSHAVPSSASAGAKGSSAARTYIKTVTTDKFGHVTGVTTGTETVKDTNTAHTHTAGTGLTITGEGGIDGNVEYAVNFDVVAKKSDIKPGTITGVTAGNGLTGGGSSGNVTVNVGAGTGITVAANDVAVTDYNNILTAKGNNLATEGGVTILLCCGDSTGIN